MFSGLCGYDVQALQSLEVAAVVAQQGEAVPERGAAYQQVEISDDVAFGSQATPFSGEQTAYGYVQWNDSHAREKGGQRALLRLWVRRVELTFVQFGERYDAQSDSLRQERVKHDNRTRPFMLVVYHPIGIE